MSINTIDQASVLKKSEVPWEESPKFEKIDHTITIDYQAIEDHQPPSDQIQVMDIDNYAEGIRYDPTLIANEYRSRFFLVIRRFFNILIPILFFVFQLWWDKRTAQVEQNQLTRAVRLRELITNLGPAYIKVGQALSTRPDVVPAVYLEELSKLQDQLPPFPNEIAFEFIKQEIGHYPLEIYAELSPNPIAAASLGQVYKAKLKTGEIVAVKVQRPDLGEKIALDLYILRNLACWVTSTFKNRFKSDLVGIMDEFGKRIFEEMDYSLEGRNAEKFAQLYGHLPDIYVPKIYWEYTGKRVLTMEWINGTKLTNLEGLKKLEIDATYILDVGVQCSLRQLLENGFFHADPHPGNLLATNDGKLAYLDFGMMSQVEPYQRYGLVEAIVHLVNRDFDGLAQDYVKLEFLTPDTDLSPIIPALATIFNQALGASVADLNFKKITDQLSDLMYEYPFKVPAYYALIIRSLVTLEGLAINIDPNFKVLSKAYPYIAKRLLTDPSPQLRNSLKDLLFKEDSFRWNRLENLLKNAQNSPDYDFNQVLNQTLDFIFSTRGEFIREQLANEIIKSVDHYGQKTWQRISSIFREGITWNNPNPSQSQLEDTPNNIEHIKRIWQILINTPGFDAISLLPLIPQTLAKSETQQMGQKIIGELAQRVAARLIREILISGDYSNSQNGSNFDGNIVLHNEKNEPFG